MDRRPRARERKSDGERGREGEREGEREGGLEIGKGGVRGREVEGREREREREQERERAREREKDTHANVSPDGADNNGKWRAHTRKSIDTHTNTHTYIDASP